MVSATFKCTARGRVLLGFLVLLLSIFSVYHFFPLKVFAWPVDRGMTWHYFSYNVDEEFNQGYQDQFEAWCQSEFGVGFVPTMINHCQETAPGVFDWLHFKFISCNRPCTSCPTEEVGIFESDCSPTTCSSGWTGDITGCPASSANLSISIFNDRDGDGVRGVDEDSVSALVRIYQSGVGEVHMFTGIGLDRDFPDGDYRVKIEPLSGWIPTKWSVDHTPAQTITTYKACAEGPYCTIAEAPYPPPPDPPLNVFYPLRVRSTYVTYLTLGLQQVLYTCPIEDFQESGVAQSSLRDTWQYAPFTPSHSGEVDGLSVKAGNFGGAARAITCKVTDATGTIDISATLSSATFTSASGAAWRDIDFRSNKFNLTGGVGYKIACKGPDAWNSLYWIYLNEPVNGKTFRVYKCLRTHSLTGKLWEDNVIKNCVINSTEAKLGNWIVTVQGPGGYYSDFTSSLAGSEGEYTISNIPVGTYSVCISSPPSQYWYLTCVKEDGNPKIAPDYPSFCYDVTISANKVLNFGVRKRYPINGRVCDDTAKGSASCSLAPLTSICADQLIGSKPAVGVRLCTGDDVCATTNANGTYSLPGLFAGQPYDVCITNRGGYPGQSYTLSCQTPIASGDCSSILSLPEGGTTSNFGFTKKPTKAWFQIIGSSDIHANGGVASLINTSAAYPYLLISPAPNPTVNAYGVVSAVSEVLLNSRPVTPNNNWQVANYTTIKGNPAPISFETSINFNRDKFDTLYATALTFNPQGNLDLGKVYKLPTEEEGPVDVNIPGYKLSGDGSVIVLVDGDVDIKNLKKNPAAPANSMIILIATGDIIARDSVDKLDAVLISMAGVVTIDTKGDKNDSRIAITGAIYAKNGINLLRNRELTDNNLLPTETITFQPFLLSSSLFPTPLLKSHRTWREVE